MCIYFIYIQRANKKRGNKMAVANLKKIDKKLNDLYKDQITTNTKAENFVDRSEVLLAQMNFIAVANKQALHLV